MISMYLRDHKGFPGAAFAAKQVSDTTVGVCVASWNARVDKDKFVRERSKLIAEARLERGNYDVEVLLGENLVRRILRRIAEDKLVKVVSDATGTSYTPRFPQRARDGAKNMLATFERNDIEQAITNAVLAAPEDAEMIEVLVSPNGNAVGDEQEA